MELRLWILIVGLIAGDRIWNFNSGNRICHSLQRKLVLRHSQEEFLVPEELMFILLHHINLLKLLACIMTTTPFQNLVVRGGERLTFHIAL